MYQVAVNSSPAHSPACLGVAVGQQDEGGAQGAAAHWLRQRCQLAQRARHGVQARHVAAAPHLLAHQLQELQQ